MEGQRESARIVVQRGATYVSFHDLDDGAEELLLAGGKIKGHLDGWIVSVA